MGMATFVPTHASARLLRDVATRESRNRMDACQSPNNGLSCGLDYDDTVRVETQSTAKSEFLAYQPRVVRPLPSNKASAARCLLPKLGRHLECGRGNVARQLMMAVKTSHRGCVIRRLLEPPSTGFSRAASRLLLDRRDATFQAPLRMVAELIAKF